MTPNPTLTSNRPIDFPLAFDQEVYGGVMHVMLPTLDALEVFWAQNKCKYHYAAQGIALTDHNDYMQPYEWFFSSDVALLMRASLRWNELNIVSRFYDFTKEAPAEAESFFDGHDRDRSARLKQGLWTARDEKTYQRYSRKNYKGYWILENLPCGISFSDYFCGCPEISDFDLDSSCAADLLLEALFHTSAEDNFGSKVEYFTACRIEEEIQYWTAEKLLGEDYYGKENE